MGSQPQSSGSAGAPTGPAKQIAVTSQGQPVYEQTTTTGTTIYVQGYAPGQVSAPNFETLVQLAREGNQTAIAELAQRGFALNSAGYPVNIS